jgi:hypothetical protein
MLSPLVGSRARKVFQAKGFLLLEDFLPHKMFAALEAEARSFHGEGIEQIQGDTRTQHVYLGGESLQGLPACDAVISYRPMQRLLRYTGSHLARPDFFLQRICNGFEDAVEDPQKTLHSDTFHPTIKAWLFIDDVPLDRGPFTYVPGSHQLTWRRLRWEYRQSLQARNSPNSHTANGSFRVSEADLATMGLPAPQAIAVHKNTLVIANTHGFHCRGQAPAKATRLELWAFSRKNPFNPFPGLGSERFDRFKSRTRWLIRKRLEEQQIKAGQRPVWKSTLLDFRDLGAHGE